RGGKKAVGLVTEMSQPLGHAVGNAIEVNECVDFLREGKGEARLQDLTLKLAEELFLLGKKVPRAEARKQLAEALRSGRAYEKFLEIVELQGGDRKALERGLPLAPRKLTLKAGKSGRIRAMDGEAIGLALVELAGGRKRSS